MSTRVYARLDDDRIEQLDAECKKRDVYRSHIVTAAVELYLDTDGKVVKALDDLREACDAVEKQRNKFKDKYERAVQTNAVLIAKIRELQSQGLVRRALGVKRIDTELYRVCGGSE